MDLVTISTTEAPAAVGPYVQAVAHDGVLYCSGALPIDPVAGTLDNADIATEARRCLANLEAVCRAAGTSLQRAVRMTIYTTDLPSFADLNAAYAEHFSERYPGRATVGVAALPLGATVEIDAIVALP